LIKQDLQFIALPVRLDRYIVHSKVKVTTWSESESQSAATVTVRAYSARITMKLQDQELSDSKDGRQLQSQSVRAWLEKVLYSMYFKYRYFQLLNFSVALRQDVKNLILVVKDNS